MVVEAGAAAMDGGRQQVVEQAVLDTIRGLAIISGYSLSVSIDLLRNHVRPSYAELDLDDAQFDRLLVELERQGKVSLLVGTSVLPGQGIPLANRGTACWVAAR